ncbi:MAG TPA: type III secretion system chaperone [Myxococcota bacterium]|nr:type III secretion system chaperone [Myxococcota bacterium]
MIAQRPYPKTAALFQELAATLGLSALQPDDNGAIQLKVGKATMVALFAQDDRELMVVVPIAALPEKPDYGVVLWLLRRNFFDADLGPFRLAADAGGTLVLWGRVPLEGMTGASLAELLDALGGEAERVVGELGTT